MPFDITISINRMGCQLTKSTQVIDSELTDAVSAEVLHDPEKLVDLFSTETGGTSSHNKCIFIFGELLVYF